MAKAQPANRKASKLNQDEIAAELVRRLDGISIEDAKNALIRAASLLDKTQFVSAKSRLLS